MKEITETKILIYSTESGNVPFNEFLDSIDIKVRVIIEKRIDRMALGNWGEYRDLKDGVYELKIQYGPGYKVYFGRKGKDIVLLLCGGDKGSQKKDRAKAKKLWRYENE